MLHLAAVRQENCTRSRLEPKSALALNGRLAPMFEEIVRSGSGSIDCQAPDPSDGQRGKIKINGSGVGVEQEEQVMFSLPQNQARKGFLPRVRPVGSSAVSPEPPDLFVGVERFSS